MGVTKTMVNAENEAAETKEFYAIYLINIQNKYFQTLFAVPSSSVLQCC